MIKALLKKQMMESFSWIYFSQKNGKKRDAKGILFYVILYLFIFGMLGFMVYMMADSLCEPLCTLGLGWLYMALMGLVAVVLGVFGSVFNTFSSLYQAKDNDLLFAMPIPTSNILTMRLSGVYAIGFMYEMIVMIPTWIAWFKFSSVGIVGIICTLLIPFVLSFFILTLSCALGWVVALVSTKVRNKSVITTILSLAFLGGYYYVYFRAYELLMEILTNAQKIADNVKSILFPIYHMGLAAEGHVGSMLIFTVIILALFTLTYVILSRSFIRLATTNKGAEKVKFKEHMVKTGNVESALLHKELKRFVGSAVYMMNCGLGILFMVVGAVAILIKADTITEVLPLLQLQFGDKLPLILAAALCFTASMIDITAPSISLEGKNIWIIQVLPVTGWQVLRAKLKLHLVLALPPTILLTVCLLIVVRPSIEFMVLIPLVVIAFVIVMAMLGLVLNLKTPNLNWTNEAVPIKQSFSVTVALFGGWVIVAVLGIMYALTNQWLPPVFFLAGIFMILIAVAALELFWLKKTGTKILASL